MKHFKTLFLGSILFTAVWAPSAFGVIVYNNSTTDLNKRFNPDVAQVGDEIVLSAANVQLTNFTFQYWGTNFNGNELAQVRFFYNDGTNSTAGPRVPGSLFFDSGTFAIGATPRSTLSFDLPFINVTSSNFTWTVQFFNVTTNTGEAAGVDLYSPPTVGSNFDDYWEQSTNGGWALKIVPGTPVNFAARVEAVPEPSTIALGFLGVLGLLSAGRRRFFK